MEVVKRHSLPKEEVDQKKEKFSNLVRQGTDSVPASLRPYFEKVGPVLTGLCSLYLALQPFVLAAHELWGILMTITPPEVWGLVTGFFLCFYGGNFILLVAAYQAFMLCGWEATKRNFNDLQEEYTKAKAIADELLEQDNDGDGIKDKDQLNQAQIMLGRLSTFTAACKEPAKIQRAVAGIFSALLGVIATLKFNMAQVCVLGASMGLTIQKTLKPFLEPKLKSSLPEKNHHWIDTILSTLCVFIGMNTAIIVQGFMSTLQTATNGAQLLVTNALLLLNAKGIASGVTPTSQSASYATYGLVGLGVFFQLYSEWMPFPLNFICLPAYFAEGVLYSLVVV